MSLEKRYLEVIEPKLKNTQCGFVLAVTLQTNFSLYSKFSRNLGVCQRFYACFVDLEKHVAGSSGKVFGVLRKAEVRCWPAPIAGHQVTVFLLRPLCRVACLALFEAKFVIFGLFSTPLAFYIFDKKAKLNLAKAFCECPSTLHRKQLENNKQNVDVATPRKNFLRTPMADTHG